MSLCDEKLRDDVGVQRNLGALYNSGANFKGGFFMNEVRESRQVAANYDAESQFRRWLGCMAGKIRAGHKPDNRKAVKWCTKASGEGYINARSLKVLDKVEDI